jgi:hypothetical protein
MSMYAGCRTSGHVSERDHEVQITKAQRYSRSSHATRYLAFPLHFDASRHLQTIRIISHQSFVVMYVVDQSEVVRHTHLSRAFARAVHQHSSCFI